LLTIHGKPHSEVVIINGISMERLRARLLSRRHLVHLAGAAVDLDGEGAGAVEGRPISL